MKIENYEKLYDLMNTLNVTLDELESAGAEIPCISTNVKLLKTHAQMLAVELGCEKV